MSSYQSLFNTTINDTNVIEILLGISFDVNNQKYKQKECMRGKASYEVLATTELLATRINQAK